MTDEQPVAQDRDAQEQVLELDAVVRVTGEPIQLDHAVMGLGRTARDARN